MADSKVVKLLKIVQHETGKDILSNLDEKRLSLLEGYYNSLSEDEQDKIDEKIINGEDNDFAEVAEGMAFGMINGEVAFSKTPVAVADPPPSSALAVVPKKPEDLVDEEIDSRILSILGLEDVFDLTYEEYATLLREAAARGRMSETQMSTESIELITEEFKRVRGKTGKFKVKPKKVDINKVLDRKQPTPSGSIIKAQKLIPQAPEVASEQEKKTAVDTENLQEDLINGIGNILESLITIRTLMQGQGKSEKKAAQEDRKQTEKKKKKERESTLEKKKPKFPLIGAIKKPIDDFFGAIKRFFTNILLGSVVLGLFRWLKDPKNQKAIDGFTNFLEKNAGLILGGLLAIASLPLVPTLLSLTGAVIGGIGTLGTALGGLTTLLPAFGLFGAFVGGQMIFKNLQKFVGGEDAPAVQSELYKLKKDLQLQKGLALLKSGKEKEDALKKIEEDEKKLNRIEQELLPRMTKTQSMKRENEKLKKEIEQQEQRLEDIKKGKVVFPIESQKQQTIDKIRQAIRSKNEKISENEKNIPISKKIQDDLMKDIMGPEGAQGDVIDKIDRFIKDAQKMVENLNTNAKPSTPLMPGLPPSAAQPGTGPAGNPVGSGSVVEYITGDATHPNFEYEGHGTTSNYHDHIAFRTKEDKERAKLALQQAGIQIGSENRPWDTDSYHGAGLAIDIPGAQWGGRGAIGETEYAGSRKVRAVLAAAGFSGAGISGGASGTPSRSAQIARRPAPTPSIPSPTGRGNIVPLPILTGGGADQSQSNSAPLQSPVPRFSSEDPNNMTTMVVRAIYNVVG